MSTHVPYPQRGNVMTADHFKWYFRLNMLIIERLSRSSESNIDDTDLFNHQVSRKFVKQYFWYLRLTSTHVIYFRKNWQNEAKKQNFLKCLIFSGHLKKVWYCLQNDGVSPPAGRAAAASLPPAPDPGEAVWRSSSSCSQIPSLVTFSWIPALNKN